MQKSTIISFIFFLFFVNQLLSQEKTTPAESRKKNIKELLDYRYIGGFHSFERLFYKTVEYPEIAKKNCVIGISIVRFEVDCKGEIKNLIINNPLGWGIDQQIQFFLRETMGNWNICSDDKYTRFEVPIQFIINETETNSTDAMMIYQVDLVGYKCKGDSFYREKLDLALEKNSDKKAYRYLKELIKRDPYNTELTSLRKEILDRKK